MAAWLAFGILFATGVLRLVVLAPAMVQAQTWWAPRGANTPAAQEVVPKAIGG
ncbi:MAG: hypothetical protein HKN72_00725 [Gemmatimonadetes bacterium]|nr:hypothetical protein [Gemmatimonadota bacterium]